MRSSPPFCRTLLPAQDTSEIHLTCVGWEKVGRDESYPAQRNPIHAFQFEEGRVLPEFCLAWCVEGQGELETDAGYQEVRAGEGFLYVPGEWHRHRPSRTSGWILDWMHFDGALPRRWNEQRLFRLRGNKPIIGEPDLFAAQLWRLLVSAGCHPTGHAPSLSMQMLGLFSHMVIDRSEDSPAAVKNAMVAAARAFIVNHPGGSFAVADVAAHLGCSRRTLEMQFRKVTGHTVLEEIQACRIERARALLIGTELPIKQIVQRAGFQSREQMRLVFLKALGCSPLALRSKPDGPE